MPKDIAVISYNLNPSSSPTSDAIVFRDILNANGYSARAIRSSQSQGLFQDVS